MKNIYVDNASTTKVTEKVLSAVLPYLTTEYGNPSSLHTYGQATKSAISNARHHIAQSIGAKPSEIYFTSGGTESDNWAIKGVAYALKKQGKNHIITSTIEHHAILNACKQLEQEGFEVTYLPVTNLGYVLPTQVEQAIKDTTALVSIMTINNELGIFQNVSAIGRVCHKHNVLFHTDAVQGIGHALINVNTHNIDLMSVSAHKIHGLKGCGLLYIKEGVSIDNLIVGGGQEFGKRAGTENVAGIVSLDVALQEVRHNLVKQESVYTDLYTRLRRGISDIKDHIINGDCTLKTDSIINISFKGIEGEALLMKLNKQGIYASSASACMSGSLEPSHVLKSIGVSDDYIRGTIRLSFGEDTTEDDIDYIVECIKQDVAELRKYNPFWEE